MPKLTIDIEARLASFQDSLDKISRDAGGIAGKLEGAFGVLKGALAGLGVGVGVSGLAGLVKDSIAATAALDDLSEKTSLSVETLSALREVARVGGHNLDSVAAGASKFARSVAEAVGGNKELGAAFKALGISLTDADGKLRNFDDLFVEFAKAIANAENPTIALAYAVKLAGKAAADQIPFYRDLAEYGKLTAKVTTEQAAAAEKLEKDFKRLSQTTEELKIALGVGLLPVLQEVVNGLRVLKELNIGDVFTAMTAGIDNATYAGLSKIDEQLAGLKKRRDEITQEVKGGAGLLAPFKLIEQRGVEKEIAILEKQRAALENLMKVRDKVNAPAPEAAPKRALDAGALGGAATGVGARVKKDLDELDRIYGGYEGAYKAFADSIKRAADDAQAWAEADIDHWQKMKDGLTEADRALIKYIDDQQEAERRAGEAANGGKSGLQVMEDDAKRAAEAGKEMGLVFTSALSDAIVEGKKFSEVLRALGKDVAQLILKKTVTPLLEKGVDSLLGPVLKGIAGIFSAKGNVFGPGGLVPFALGGVVNRPTLFPFAAGVGLMGESGPEAIMPLKRGADGRLGVAAAAGGGTPVTVVINASAIDARSLDQMLAARAETIAAAVSKAANARGRRGPLG